MNNALPVIIVGGGGHASVLVELLCTINRTILGFVAPKAGYIHGYPQVAYLGADEILTTRHGESFELVMGIGSISIENNLRRQKLFRHFKQLGFQFATLVHPMAVIASTAQLAEGVQIMARVVLQPNVIIDQNTIINTGSCIDHDSYIGKGVHIAPGVTCSGNVKIGDEAMVGVGACLIQGVEIPKQMMVRAGSTVVKSKVIREVND